MGLVKGQAKRDAVGQPFTNVKEPRPYPTGGGLQMFLCNPPPAPEGRGECWLHLSKVEGRPGARLVGGYYSKFKCMID